MTGMTALFYAICVPIMVILGAVGLVVLSFAIRAIILIVKWTASLISYMKSKSARGKLIYRDDSTEIRYYG